MSKTKAKLRIKVCHLPIQAGQDGHEADLLVTGTSAPPPQVEPRPLLGDQQHDPEEAQE